MGQRKRNMAADYALYLVVRILLCILQALPDSACLALSRALAWFFCDVLRFREQVINDNLKHAFPGMSAERRREIGREMWRHLMVLICEIARAHRKIHATNWRQHVDFEGCRELVLNQLLDRGLVIVTAHFGNFEISGYVAGLLGMPCYTVARPLDNPYLHDFMMRFRESTGQHIISSRGTAETVGRVVENGYSIAILGDHYGGPKGCWVDFLNRPASCHKSVALLALNYDVPLLVFNTQRVGPLMQFRMKADTPLLDPTKTKATVKDATQWFTSRIEAAILDCPEQYWWLHRRWKDTRDDLKKARLARRAGLVRIDGPSDATSQEVSCTADPRANSEARQQ